MALIAWRRARACPGLFPGVRAESERSAAFRFAYRSIGRRCRAPRDGPAPWSHRPPLAPAEREREREHIMEFQDRQFLRLGGRHIALVVVALASIMLASAGAAQAKRTSGT